MVAKRLKPMSNSCLAAPVATNSAFAATGPMDTTMFFAGSLKFAATMPKTLRHTRIPSKPPERCMPYVYLQARRSICHPPPATSYHLLLDDIQ